MSVLAQFDALDFPRWPLRKGLHEFYDFRSLELAEELQAVMAQFLFCRRAARSEHDTAHNILPIVLIGDAHSRAIQHCGMPVQHLIYLPGRYVFSPFDDQFLDATRHEDEAVLIHISQVARAEPSVVLKGLRGEQPSDIAAIEDALKRLSQLAADFPKIAELDINPLIVHPAGQGCHVADVRIRLEE